MRKKKFHVSKRGKDILVSWAVISAVSFGLGFAVGSIGRPTAEDAMQIPKAAQQSLKSEITEPIEEPKIIATNVINPVQMYKYTSLGEYKISAYCSCPSCCGYWASIRPTDEDGQPIVYTASGAIAKQGVTVAADASIFPFGTVLLIDGKEYTVQDRGGLVDGKHIDIYFDSHEEAVKHGVRYTEIYVKENA